MLPPEAAATQFRFPSPTWDARLGCPAGTYADGVLQVPTQCTPCPEGRRTSGKRRSGIGWVNFMVGSMLRGLTIQKWIKMGVMHGDTWGFYSSYGILWHIMAYHSRIMQHYLYVLVTDIIGFSSHQGNPGDTIKHGDVKWDINRICICICK